MKYNRKRPKKELEPVNRNIKFREVMVIDEASGEQLGVMPTNQAIQKAEEQGLDLFCVSPKAQPPVCKILDFGKYKYARKKAQKESKKNQTVILVKEIRLKPQIGDHDLMTKVNNAVKFLKEGNRVKLSLKFSGRQNIFRDLGKNVLLKFKEKVGQHGEWEKEPYDNGRFMDAFIKPNKKVNKGEDNNAKDENEESISEES